MWEKGRGQRKREDWREESAVRGGLRQEVEEEMGPANVSGSRGRSLPLSPVRIKRRLLGNRYPPRDGPEVIIECGVFGGAFGETARATLAPRKGRQ